MVSPKENQMEEGEIVEKNHDVNPEPALTSTAVDVLMHEGTATFTCNSRSSAQSSSQAEAVKVIQEDRMDEKKAKDEDDKEKNIKTDALEDQNEKNNVADDVGMVEKREIKFMDDHDLSLGNKGPEGLENNSENESNLNVDDPEVDLVHENEETKTNVESKKFNTSEQQQQKLEIPLVLEQQKQILILLAKLLEQSGVMKQENKLIMDDPLLVVPSPGDEWLQCPECRVPFLREKQEGCRPINCPNCPHVWSICTRNNLLKTCY